MGRELVVQARPLAVQPVSARATRRSVVVLCLVGAFGCSSSSATEGEDAVADAGPTDDTNVATETSSDSATTDTLHDDTLTAKDTAADSETFDSARDSVVVDSVADAAADADARDDGTDVPTDVVSDAPRPGPECAAGGGGRCASGQVCCFNTSFGGGVCKSALTSCASGSSRLNCSGRIDCAAGEVCCATYLKGSSYLLNTSCTTDCRPFDPVNYYSAITCSLTAPMDECPSGTTCVYGGMPYGDCR